VESRNLLKRGTGMHTSQNFFMPLRHRSLSEVWTLCIGLSGFSFLMVAGVSRTDSLFTRDLMLEAVPYSSCNIFVTRSICRNRNVCITVPHARHGRAQKMSTYRMKSCCLSRRAAVHTQKAWLNQALQKRIS
jgi:hypothetical protein